MARVQYVQFGDLPLQSAADCEARTFHKQGKIRERSLVTCHCSSLRSTHAVWYPATAVWYPSTAVWYPATAVWYPATAVWYPATAVWYPATAV
jgi:hypothetical protein